MRRVFHLQHSLPSVSAVLRRLGYNPKKTETADWVSRIEKAIGEFSPFLEARGIIDTLRVVSRTDAMVILENGLILNSTKLAFVLAQSEEVSLVAATLGKMIEKKLQYFLSSGEITQATLLDAIASESIEHFVDWMQAIVARERLRFAFSPTMRFSPGYGDWKLDIQPEILRVLKAEEIGLSVHPESYILLPEKSITAVIGWEKK
ncbi:MAG: hypothetical protein ACK4TN_00250 [Brevinematales bacterium]